MSMYGIAIFGVFLMLCSSVMIFRPQSWTAFWQKFSDKFYFHTSEIISRATFSAVFFLFGDHTQHPLMMTILGGILLIATIVLLLMGPTKHREFAKRSTLSFQKFFRPAGIATFAFGGFLVYAALRGSGNA